MVFIQPDDPKILFHVRTLQGRVMKFLFDSLKDIVHDIVLTFDPSGIKVSSMDSSKVSLIYLRLDAESFEEYYCKKSVDIGVHVENIFKLLKSSGSHDVILFSHREDDSNKLHIELQSVEKNSITNFSLRLIEMDNTIVEISDIEFDTIITMPSNYFHRLCRDMNDIADYIRIENDNGAVSFSCESDFASQKTMIGNFGEGNITNNVDGARYRGTFPLKYLINFCKASGLSNVVEILLKEDYPLVLNYRVGSMGGLRFIMSGNVND
jgi:proliferating cell nuclear antigen